MKDPLKVREGGCKAYALRPLSLCKKEIMLKKRGRIITNTPAFNACEQAPVSLDAGGKSVFSARRYKPVPVFLYCIM